jgi:hypothetical protein
MNQEIHFCNDCKFIRIKKRANPFDGRLDVLNPDILKARNKWEEKQNEIAELERQRFDTGVDFDYEPNFYPWCAAWTESDGRFTIDPVTGNKTLIYILCAAGNERGDCPRFEANES